MSTSSAPHPGRAGLGRGLRFVASWAIAAALVAAGLPKLVGVTWHSVLPAFAQLRWSTALGLVAVWFAGLLVHTFVLTAAAPRLSHRRALTLNLTGSAVSNVVPLGGAAGVELNRRMMKSWGLDARTFTGFTFLTNLWDVGAKLLLPVVALVALAHAGIAVSPSLRTFSLISAGAFVCVCAVAAPLLLSPRGASMIGGTVEWVVRAPLRVIGRDRDLALAQHLLEIRSDCARLVARGWLRMSLGIGGYLALQAVLLGWCLHLTGVGASWPVILAGFAVERALTVLPLTPGGIGIADIGLVGMLLALGGDPTAVTAGAVLYRAFVFAVEIPVGGGALALWVLVRRRASRRQPTAAPIATLPGAHRATPRDPAQPGTRIAHVTDVFLPRLGGIETHVDDLARHQRARGLDARVITPPASDASEDPAWVRRLSVRQATRELAECDVVHVHLSVLSPYGLRLARAAAGAEIATLITVHSMWTGAATVLRFAARASLRRWPVAWSAVSTAAATSFESALRRSVAVLPNAIEVSDWRYGAPRPPLPSSAAPAAPAARVSGSHTTVVSVMRLMPRKRPMPLLRIFRAARRLNPDVDLVIVGDGPLRRRLERYVARHRLDGVVRFTGRLSRKQVLAELRAATLYVSPAPKESFGLAALEARCTGLPVVARRRSGIEEFVSDRVGGLLIDSDAQMAVAIADLAKDARLRTRLAEHNRRVPPRQDWTWVLDRTTELYHEAALAAGHGREPRPAARALPRAAGA
ncbi:glycosyltransferase [Nocardioides sp. BP30]|uniref:glycosyltransferase n=1 Tax=Nocardioides sp. BP30 TaxID=3036374 RepID=UPI002469799E|nr:glycosyltransferase [Nocardioides sp. BP30]WGL52501.1 glycosyltransferase [Nocardioides sp. BP30]